MTIFQWLTLICLALVVCWDLRSLWRSEGQSALHLFRLAIWIGAGVCVYKPDLTSDAARLFGIQRGADLVTYAFHFAFLAAALFFYARYLKLRTMLTEIIRHLAIREAALGQPAADVNDRAMSDRE